MSRPHLPVSRVNTIMKSSSDVEVVSKESANLLTRAAEHFIKVLAAAGYATADGGKKLDYRHVAEVVHRDERYDFLRDIMPKKITVAEFKRIVARKRENGQNGDASASSTDESSSEDSDEDAAASS